MKVYFELCSLAWIILGVYAITEFLFMDKYDLLCTVLKNIDLPLLTLSL